MFINCYNGYGLCQFSVKLKEGVEAELLGSVICAWQEMIAFWLVADQPNGAIVRY